MLAPKAKISLGKGIRKTPFFKEVGQRKFLLLVPVEERHWTQFSLTITFNF